MVKTALSGIFSLAFIFTSLAQSNQFTTAKIDEIQTGMRNTTYVVLMDPEQKEISVQYEQIVNDSIINSGGRSNVLTDDNPYNTAIKDAMKLWRLGKYEFITWAEFEEKKLDPASSFIFPIKVRENLFNQRIESMYLVYGVGGRRGTRPDRMSRIAAVPLAYYTVSDYYYLWKLPAMIQYLQGHADYVAGLSEVTDAEILSYYHSKGSQVKDYTLYVAQDDLTTETWSLEKIAENYAGDVKIVSQAELKELMLKKPEGAAFFHKAGPERSLLENAMVRKFVISMKDGECIYVSEEEIKKKSPEGLTVKDLKNFK